MHSEPKYLFCHCPVSNVSLRTPNLPDYYLLGSILLWRIFRLFLPANCYLLQNYKDPCKHPVIAHKLPTIFKRWEMHFYLSNSCTNTWNKVVSTGILKRKYKRQKLPTFLLSIENFPLNLTIKYSNPFQRWTHEVGSLKASGHICLANKKNPTQARFVNCLEYV